MAVYQHGCDSAAFHIDIIFINKPHIWSPNKYILT